MNIFLSTPISQYKSKAELQAYKESLIHLISQLRKKHNVCTEIEAIYSETDYDTPEKSISKDLESVKNVICLFCTTQNKYRLAHSLNLDLHFHIKKEY